jgi:hypothetical protein
MKKTAQLFSVADRMDSKYSLTKTANPSNLSYKLIDLVQEILDKKHHDLKYRDPGVQHAMSEALSAMNSLIMALTSGKLISGLDPVEVNKYDE